MRARDVSEAYKQWAESYDKDSKWNVAIQAEKGLIIPLLRPNKNDKILEIGCGTERLTIPIAKKCRKIVGVDFSEAMLNVAKRKAKSYKNIELLKLDASKKLPFDESSFDKVACPLVLNHIKDIDAFFYRVHRVLKRRGILVFDDILPNAEYFKVKFHTVLDDLYDAGKRLFYIHSIDDYVNSLNRSDFVIQEIKFVRFDEKVKPLVIRRTYTLNKGRTFGFIFRSKKE
jgi:ubiquinone/menaquinone biosynthesis C-methylase UbiE